MLATPSSATLASNPDVPSGVHPIVPHRCPSIHASDRRRAAGLARRILSADPLIGATEVFGRGVRAGLREGPTLHIHDTERISDDDRVFGREHRALLLARGGDVVAMGRPPVKAFQDHCRDDLGLGGPTVLVPRAMGRPRSLSTRCRQDPEVVACLSKVARERGHLNVAPYIASGGVWALAGAVAEASGGEVFVGGPPAALCRKVNNKIWFAGQIADLLGRGALPLTMSARGWAVLASQVRECARLYPSVGVKLPSESGASGNFVIDSALVRRLPSLLAVKEELRRLFRHLGWDRPFPMLVSVWEESVLVTPSVQLWIPQEGHGDPVVEGVFDQSVLPEAGKFVGCAPSELSEDVATRLSYDAVLLGLVFQTLGYYGRCSFDAIVVGEDLSKAEVHWIECNGRWGGTSIPMTLVNRLVGDWMRRPFVVVGSVRGEALLTLEEAITAARSQLFDRREGTGLAFLSPGPAETGTGLDLMSVGRTLREARQGASRAMDLVRRVAG